MKRLLLYPPAEHFQNSSSWFKTKKGQIMNQCPVWIFPLRSFGYQERYTCPSLALHPLEESFVAQTNGNYVAVFSSQQPYRMNKRRRYEGHKVSNNCGLEGGLGWGGRWLRRPDQYRMYTHTNKFSEFTQNCKGRRLNMYTHTDETLIVSYTTHS